MAEIFREQTNEEKKDFKTIMNPPETIEDRFKKELQKVEYQFQKNKKPFCARCARMDFKEQIQGKLKKMSDNVDYETDINKFKIELPDFTVYGEESRFKEIGQKELFNPANAAKGDKAHMEYATDYKCTVRGCGLSIFTGNNKEK